MRVRHCYCFRGLIIDSQPTMSTTGDRWECVGGNQLDDDLNELQDQDELLEDVLEQFAAQASDHDINELLRKCKQTKHVCGADGGRGG